jgi:hypothetical protein
MIFVAFFLLLFSTQLYFSALIKSHLFDISIESLSIQQLQTQLYVESLCVYIGSIITETEAIRTSDQTNTIYFSEVSFDEHDPIQVVISTTKEVSDQFLLTITCTRLNNISHYYARIKIETASFTIIAYEPSKKELFQ